MTEKEIEKLKLRNRARRTREFIEACKNFREQVDLFCDCVLFGNDREELQNVLCDAGSAALRAQNGAVRLHEFVCMRMWEIKRAELYEEPEASEVSNG